MNLPKTVLNWKLLLGKMIEKFIISILIVTLTLGNFTLIELLEYYYGFNSMILGLMIGCMYIFINNILEFTEKLKES